MNNKPYVTTYWLGLVIGILLCIFNNKTNILTLMVIILGALLILPSIFGIGKGFVGKKNPDGTRSSLPWYLAAASVLGLVAGILLISFASFFAGYIVYTLGVLLIIAGIIQIMCLVTERHDTGSLKAGWYGMPWLTVGVGVVIVFLGPDRIADFVTLLTGITLILYGLNGLFSVLAHHSAKKRMLREEEPSQEHPKDVEEEEEKTLEEKKDTSGGEETENETGDFN